MDARVNTAAGTSAKPAKSAKKFSPAVLLDIDATKYFYIRAGDDHRFIAIWVVVAGNRVLVRPWNDKPTGWYRAFLASRRGAIRVGNREVPVRARPVRSESVLDATDAAYAAKYRTPANLKYVKGFATAKRRATTLELVPQ
jgi:hypothetical protein